MTQPKVAVIIINWNGIRLLDECLNSIEGQDYGMFKIIFVDNGSTDGSIEFVRSEYLDVEIIALDKNTGFAKANNIGIEKALEDNEVRYVALLNNDAIADKRWLSEMVRTASFEGKAGSIAPVIKKYHIRDEFDSVGMQIRIEGGGNNEHANEKDIGQCAQVKEVFGCTGCACLYSREMLNDIAYNHEYFDSDFFAYCEDVDLSWRARLLGWKCFISPNAIVYHKGSETFQVYSYVKAYYSHRNRLYVITKNFPQKLLVIGLYRFMLNYLRSMESITSNKGYSARTREKVGTLNLLILIVKGWMDFLYHLPETLRKRRFIQRRREVDVKIVERWFDIFGVNANLAKLEYRKYQDKR